MGKIYGIQDFIKGLNLTQDANIKDNQFTLLKNFYYNSSKQLETRRGMTTFGNQIGANPITSYFFYQRDDDLTNHPLCVSGTSMYKYNGTTRGSSIADNLLQYETIPGKTTQRTRWDFAVYKNDCYLFNGVAPYMKYTSSTGAASEIGMVGTVTCTLDNTTETVEKVAHGLANGDEVRLTTTGTLPTELIAYQFYYIVNKTDDDFQLSKTKGGAAVTFTSNGTGTISYNKAGKPRCRYISYLGDRLFGAGDDGNPTTLYYTNAAPADGTTISQNSLVVGGDENGRINGLAELGQIILGFKSNRVYSIDVTNAAALAVDAHNGGYSNRSIKNVANSLVYFTDKGVDTLKQRSGVTGSAALESTPLGEDVRELTKLVDEFQYNSGCAYYNKALNNYYFTFDTNNDNIPDTTLVYSTLTQGRSQYMYPNLYDYGFYIDSDQQRHYLAASANGGQMFEIETGFQDLGVNIEYELETKRFDFGTPGLNKTFDYIDVIGYASLGTEITVLIKIDGEDLYSSTITDANLSIDTVAKVVGTSPIGTSALTGAPSTTDVDLYLYTFRVPMYAMGSDISVNMSSTGGVWILDKLRISRDDQPVEVFSVSDIG